MVEFNEFQQDVINLSKGRHACLASAGSGKTEVLTERLQRALSKGIDPQKILCITFTNRAALSMLERIKQKLPNQNIKDVFVGNTHALALKLLKDEKYFSYTNTLCTPDVSDDLWRLSEIRVAHTLQKLLPDKFNVRQENISQDSYGRGDVVKHHLLSVINEEDISLLKERLFDNETKKLLSLIKTSANSLSIRESIGVSRYILSDLESVKSENFNKISYFYIYSLLKPLIKNVIKNDALKHEYIQFATDKLSVLYFDTQLEKNDCSIGLFVSVTCLLAKEYEQLKKQLSLYDFDDALCSSLELGSRQFSWIQVDECQDLSPIQWLIIKHHISEDAHMLMLGDINQSIYRFLGASIETTTKELGSSKYELPINYRSPQNLVEFFKDYMNSNFPDRFESEVKSCKDKEPNALIHVHSPEQQHQQMRLLKHAIKLVKNEKNTAFLCPTNALVDETSDFLTSNGVEHFRISRNDILTSRVALDFFSFLRCLYSDNDHLAWARLLWNFSKVSSLKDTDGETIFTPQLHSLLIVSKLVRIGGALSDLLESENLYDHFLRKFKDGVERGYTYFDTETTGLEESDNIIQVAGVNVSEGRLTGEIDLYCTSNKSVGDSEAIHKISDQTLEEKGEDFLHQIARFMSFSTDKTLIAHNLEFDERMIKSNIRKHNGAGYSQFCELPKLCSLKLSRRLYPQLKSHKLGDLLTEFGLEGVNSHNALDDVKAGANFVNYAYQDLATKIDELDEYIDKYEATFKRFKGKTARLLSEITKVEGDIDLEYLLDYYFSFVKGNRSHPIDNDKLKELRRKLVGWSKRNFKPKPVKDYLADFISCIQTLKESDLITENDNLVVSTVHKSKGLEFDYVILPSVVDAVIPPYPIQKMKQSKEKDLLIDEQKRLLYVGMTRAKQQLVIGTHDDYKGFGTRPCLFLNGLYEKMKGV